MILSNPRSNLKSSNQMLNDISLLIVVPTLDSFQLLPKLVESLRFQKWHSWRVLFVDGPSSIQHRQWIERLVTQDERFAWVRQERTFGQGIFGAMSQGFLLAHPNEWVLFWGSDDWAAGPDVLFEVVSSIASEPAAPDLVVCSGRYVDSTSGKLSRLSSFKPACHLSGSAFRKALFHGFTPPHQATLFGPGARRLLASYASGYRLSADLDYFLRLSSNYNLSVLCLDKELVHMLDGGVSSQQLLRRLQEVCRAYRFAFGFLWWFPFFSRYLNRFKSVFNLL